MDMTGHAGRLALAASVALLALPAGLEAQEREGETQEREWQTQEREWQTQETERQARQQAEPTDRDLMEALRRDGSFGMFVDALEETDLEDRLSDSGPFTVFAPTDQALRMAFGQQEWEEIRDDRERLSSLLEHHVVPGEYLTAQELARTQERTLRTMGGATLTSTARGGEGDVYAGGIEREERRGEMERPERERAAEPAARMQRTPTIQIEDARVGDQEIRAMNGVVHGVDRVLMPSTMETMDGRGMDVERRDRGVEREEDRPDYETERERGAEERERTEAEREREPRPGMTDETAERRTVVAMMERNRDLSTFANLLERSGLTRELQRGEYTVFAPTNRAFGMLPEGRMEMLEDNPQELENLLRNHIVRGSLSTNDLRRRGSVQTLAGQTFEVTADGGLRVAGGGELTMRDDLEGSNGVIHVVDDVMLPQTRTDERERETERTPRVPPLR